MRFSNLLTLFSLSGPQSPLSNNGNTYNHISSFIQEIETFESTKFTASPANNDSLYWLKTPTEPPISLSQYEFQYVLRLSDWNDQPDFLLTAMHGVRKGLEYVHLGNVTIQQLHRHPTLKGPGCPVAFLAFRIFVQVENLHHRSPSNYLWNIPSIKPWWWLSFGFRHKHRIVL